MIYVLGRLNLWVEPIENQAFFAFSTIALNAAGSFTASSASTLRLMSIFALCSAPMSWL